MPTNEELLERIEKLEKEVKALIAFKEKWTTWINEQQGINYPQEQQKQSNKGVFRNKR